jgi:two-component system, chemotaxis family, sensor kinase CheA
MMDNFKKKFIEEATEHIQDLEKALLELETNPGNKELVERVFRAMHSLKGGGAMFGFERISDFTHDLETVYDLVRSDEMEVTKDLLNLTLASVDHLSMLLNEENNSWANLKDNHEDLTRKIEQFIHNGGGQTQVVATDAAKKNVLPGGESTGMRTYYIQFHPNEDILKNGTNPLYLLDDLCQMGECIPIAIYSKIPTIEQFDSAKCYVYWDVFLATEQDINSITDVFIFVEDDCFLSVNLISENNLLQHPVFKEKIEYIRTSQQEIGITDLKDFVSGLRYAQKERNGKNAQEEKTTQVNKEHTISSIRVSSDKLDSLMNLVSELVTTQARLSLYAEHDGQPELLAIAENVQKLSRQLRDNAFSIVLIPIENMLTRFQRLVRDLSGELRKDVIFITEGADTELDKTIIENLTDPLMHIIRNSLDHGIETPHVREQLGKPKQGKIILKAFYSGASVHIQISDDGAGINPEMIRAKAISKGIIHPEAQLTQKEIIDLVFLPGFSTAANVTDVSGRGVGMDVVKRKIADIRGEVEIESEINKGTTLTIKLPLTLSIIDGLLVQITDTFYVLPCLSLTKFSPWNTRKFSAPSTTWLYSTESKYPISILGKSSSCQSTKRISNK